MEVILLEKVDNVGGIGDRVRVKSGYARNYLIPHGKATLATAANIAKFESRRAELEAKAAGELAAAQARAKKLEGRCSRSGADGRRRQAVRLRRYGRHRRGNRQARHRRGAQRDPLAGRPAAPHRRAQIELHLHTDVNVGITVVIEADRSRLTPERSRARAAQGSRWPKPQEPPDRPPGDRAPAVAAALGRSRAVLARWADAGPARLGPDRRRRQRRRICTAPIIG